MSFLGTRRPAPEPPTEPIPAGYVIVLVEDTGPPKRLTDASVREDPEEARRELGQWRKQMGGYRFRLATLVLMEER